MKDLAREELIDALKVYYDELKGSVEAAEQKEQEARAFHNSANLELKEARKMRSSINDILQHLKWVEEPEKEQETT